MSIYYVDAADWLRAIGITVVEVDGWKTRARSSGGFAAPPLGVQWHHTASNTTPTNDTNYMFLNAEDAPIGNMLLARDGSAWLGAAGAANTAGKGGPLTLSRGTVPLDGANSRTWAIEAANAGTGEQWPAVQIDAYFAISNELNRRFGNLPSDIFNHQTWAEDRKIDPATAAAVAGSWQPASSTSSGTWDQSDVVVEANRRATGATPPPEPEPPPEEDEVTDDDIERIAKRSAQLTWQYMLGDITTSEMNEAGDIMRSGMYQARLAADRSAKILESS
jgi:hypothetical protein